MNGLVVADKWKRVKNYQQQTLDDFLELFAAAGCERLSELNRTMINKKINDKIESYSVFYPSVATGAYLKEERVAP